MLPKKVLDLRTYPGLPKFLVFTDDDRIFKPYSSWDLVSNSRKLVETNMYRRYDVVFSSSFVRERCLKAIWDFQCVIAHFTLDTAPCVVHIFDVVERSTFIDCCRYAPITDKDYVLIIHEVCGWYQIVSGNGVESNGYLTEALTYVRR